MALKPHDLYMLTIDEEKIMTFFERNIDSSMRASYEEGDFVFNFAKIKDIFVENDCVYLNSPKDETYLCMTLKRFMREIRKRYGGEDGWKIELKDSDLMNDSVLKFTPVKPRESYDYGSWACAGY